MNSQPMECSEQLLSELVDAELSAEDRRAVALHAAACPRCAQHLGELYATHVVVQTPAPQGVRVPRNLWQGVKAQLDRVDGLIRATSDTRGAVPQRRVVSPLLVAAGLALIAMAFAVNQFALFPRDNLRQLVRAHPHALLAQGGSSYHQAVSLKPGPAPWAPLSRSIVLLNGATILQSVYAIDGIPVSVFSVPPGQVDTSVLVPVETDSRVVYLGYFDGTLAAVIEDDVVCYVVVAHTTPEHLISLVLATPPAIQAR